MRALIAIVMGVLVLCSATGCLPDNAGDPLPVDVGVRDGLVTNGKVLQLQNTSTGTLRLELLVDRTDGKRYRYEVTLSSKQVRELGQLENVDLASGDIVTIRSGGYASEKWRIP